MIEDIRRRLAALAPSPAGWILPLAVVTLLAAAALGGRWWRASPAPPPTTVTYSTFLSRLDQRAVGMSPSCPAPRCAGSGRGRWTGPPRAAPSGSTIPTFEVTPVLERAERAEAHRSRSSPGSGLNADFWREVLLVTVALVVDRARSPAADRRGQRDGSASGRRGGARTTFGDVGGHEGTVAELRELVEFLRKPPMRSRRWARGRRRAC